MNKDFSKEFKVGLFALIGVVFVVGLGLFFNRDSFTKEGIRYYVIYNFLSGLQEGAPVKYAGGLTVGKITRIIPYGEQAKVELLVDSSIKVTSFTNFKIISAGLLGEKFINISTSPDTQSGETKAKMLQKDSVIIGAEDMGMDKLFDTVSDLVTKLSTLVIPLAQMFNQVADDGSVVKLISDIQKFFNNSNHILLDNRRAMQTMLKNINEILDKTSKGQGSLGKILNDREMGNALKDTINSLKVLIDNLTRNPVLGRSQKSTNSNNIKNFYAN